MLYSEAIEYLKKNNITKDDGTFYEFGDVDIFENFFDYLIFHDLKIVSTSRIFPKRQSAR